MLSLQCHESGSAAKLGSRTKSVRRVVRSDARRAPVPRPPRASNKRRWGFHALHDSRRHNSAMLGPSHPDTNARSPLRVRHMCKPALSGAEGRVRSAARQICVPGLLRHGRGGGAMRRASVSYLSYLISYLLSYQPGETCHLLTPTPRLGRRRRRGPCLARVALARTARPPSWAALG